MQSIAKIDKQRYVDNDMNRIVVKLAEKLGADGNVVPDGPLSSRATRHRGD